jgi:hypothetical protein
MPVNAIPVIAKESAIADPEKITQPAVASVDEDVLLLETNSLVRDTRTAILSSTPPAEELQSGMNAEPGHLDPSANTTAATFSTRDDSLQSALKNFENLSAAARHISPPERILPRPPVLAS